MSGKILNVALSAIIDNGKILLLKRAKEPYLGYWSLPGGKIHFGERVDKAALREAWEETSLDLEFEHVAGVATEFIYNEKGEAESHFVMFVVRLSVLGGEAVPGEEGELSWFDVDRLDKVSMIPSDRNMVKRFILDGGEVGVYHFEVTREGGSFSLQA